VCQAGDVRRTLALVAPTAGALPPSAGSSGLPHSRRSLLFSVQAGARRSCLHTGGSGLAWSWVVLFLFCGRGLRPQAFPSPSSHSPPVWPKVGSRRPTPGGPQPSRSPGAWGLARPPSGAAGRSVLRRQPPCSPAGRTAPRTSSRPCMSSGRDKKIVGSGAARRECFPWLRLAQ
jgi:hypothetical protein